MTGRHISEAIVADVIETGTLRRRDERHLWVFKRYQDRQDNLICAAAVDNDGPRYQDPHDSLAGESVMKTTYYPDDDILVICLNDAPVFKEVSQGWNVNISYTADDTIAEMVILEAAERGLYPVAMEERAA